MQTREQFPGHGRDARNGEFTSMRVEHLNKAAHVSALVMVRQVHRHVDGGHGMLGGLITIADAEREAHVLHTNAINGDTAFITLILRVFKSRHR